MIRSMDMVFLNGETDENTEVTGSMVNNMESENTLILMVNLVKETGLKARELGG